MQIMIIPIWSKDRRSRIFSLLTEVALCVPHIRRMSLASKLPRNFSFFIIVRGVFALLGAVMTVVALNGPIMEVSYSTHRVHYGFIQLWGVRNDSSLFTRYYSRLPGCYTETLFDRFVAAFSFGVLGAVFNVVATVLAAVELFVPQFSSYFQCGVVICALASLTVSWPVAASIRTATFCGDRPLGSMDFMPGWGLFIICVAWASTVLAALVTVTFIATARFRRRVEADEGVHGNGGVNCPDSS